MSAKLFLQILALMIIFVVLMHVGKCLYKKCGMIYGKSRLCPMSVEKVGK